MSNPDSRGGDAALAAEAARVSTETRIDTAHVLANNEAESPALCPTAVPERRDTAGLCGESMLVAEQLRTQAAQLADHLRARQRDLDHRESQLNARVAQIDNDARNARLHLKQSERELEEKEREVQACLARLATAEAAATRKHQADDEGSVAAQGEGETGGAAEQDLVKAGDPLTLPERERALEARTAALKKAREAFEKERKRAEEALEYQRQQIDAHRETSQQLVRQMLAGLERRRASIEAGSRKSGKHAWQPHLGLPAGDGRGEEAATALEAGQQQLNETQTLLAETLAETERLREQLLEDRRKVQEQGRADRQRLAAEHRHQLAELDKQRQSLQRRGEHVDRCRASLEQLRAEVGRMHRETLEIRLATEELWIQLSGSAPPAVLPRSLGQIRAKLAEHYRQANAELAEQKEELRTIRVQLAEQHEILIRQKEELEHWSARRQEEVRQQTQRLTAREQEVERQENLFNDLARQWQSEQLGYQQEIRRLRRQLCESGPPALATV